MKRIRWWIYNYCWDVDDCLGVEIEKLQIDHRHPPSQGSQNAGDGLSARGMCNHFKG